MNRRLDIVLNSAIAAAAVVVAVSLAYRTFVAPPTVRRIGDPVRVTGWEESRRLGFPAGDSTSSIEIVLLEDPECPVCRTLHTMMREVTTAPVRISHVLYPLDYHRNALAASLALECAGEQGRFGAFLDALYAKQDSLGMKSWASFALEAGIPDTMRIARCGRAGLESPRLEASRSFGQRMGLTGTPTVIIDGWRLPSPPTERLYSRIIAARAAGEHPFSRRAWRRHLSEAGLQ